MPLIEPTHAGEHTLSVSPGALSVETVTIAAGSGLLAPGTVLGVLSEGGEYQPFDETATDGSECAAAVLYHLADARTASAQATAIVRKSELSASLLVWPGSTASGIAAGESQLVAKGIILR